MQRVELYTAQLLYWLGAFPPLLLLVLTRGSGPGWQTALVVSLSAVQGVAAFLVLRGGLDPRRTHEHRPGLVLLAVSTAVLLAVAPILPGTDPSGASPQQAVVAYSVLFSPAAVAVVHRRAGWLVPLGAGAAIAVAGLLAGRPALVVVTATVFTVVGSAFIVATLRLSVWLLDVVRQLADAQGDRARLAVAEERLRFARDLHDVVGRDLSAIALKSEVVARLAERGRPEAVAEALAVRELAQSSLAEVRAVVRGHRRADLDVELAGARALLASAGTACKLRVEPGAVAALTPAAQEALAWAVREAVTNVVRHSHARQCSVSLAVVEGTGVLVVRNDDAIDDGAGPVRPGAGLSGLAERLEARGGSLQVRREHGRVVLTATVPVSPAEPGSSVASVSPAEPAGSATSAHEPEQEVRA
ncbi:sensor histidine kinase [Quadrisphaera granulorum]|uniref:sensor histidine kinase n=1 Tax=Quadrisphaera granulorum TaxID=317664 RepID=UPI0011B66467|nr:histidine kinase [Quadrisphaera granulorum]